MTPAATSSSSSPRSRSRPDVTRGPPPAPSGNMFVFLSEQRWLDDDMRILVVGGTRFIGRRFVEAALDADHDVTLVHRSATTLFPSARHVLADRNGDLGGPGAAVEDVLLQQREEGLHGG